MKPRQKKDTVTKKDLVIALIILGFVIGSAILSYFFGEYGIIKYIAGGEKLFRFWIVIGIVIISIELINRHKNRK